MRNIKLLDCTLRDGGYVNNWLFGKDIITKIVQKMVQAGVDVIECGYLSLENSGNPHVARYDSINDVQRAYAEAKKPQQEYAVMINYGEYPVDLLEVADEKSPILRVAFHKRDVEEVFVYLEMLKRKNYKYFVQPMGALNYSDEEFVQLLKRINKLNPEGFYIVDSFGVMELKDFRRLLFLADSNLAPNILLGYHSHNNLQQAYSNSKYMVEQNLEHDLIIDASVFGMGRGAGNLNIELFAEYLNQNFYKHYNIEAILEVFDECLKPIFAENFWGYSLPFYLSSIHNCHPSYASYFSEKNTLSIKSMYELLAMILEDDKISFNEKKASEYYKKYQEKWMDDRDSLEYIKSVIDGRSIMILAPGKSLNTNEIEINDYILKNKPVIFGINEVKDGYVYDFLFVSNEKRLPSLKAKNVNKFIITSNLKECSMYLNMKHKDEKCICVNYSSYLCSNDMISDNSTLMLINLLISLGYHKITIAGFDGFQATPSENYFDVRMSLGSNIETKMEKNSLIKNQVAKFKEQIDLHFITPSLYLK